MRVPPPRRRPSAAFGSSWTRIREAALVCSLAETCQRAGPAGRETPGKGWRLYQELAYEQRPMAAELEIRRFNLAEVPNPPS